MRIFSKRLAAGAVSLAVAVSALPLNVFAEGEDTLHSGSSEGRVKVISDTFSFLNDQEDVFYYSDDYFTASGKETNEHLRSMSYCLALAAIGTEDHKSTPATDLLAKIGFSDWQTYDFDVFPTEDTIACTISHKETGDGDIVAVAIRGAYYDDEIINLVVSGEEGDAKGFSEAAGKVIGRIKQYEEDNDLSGAKIWITGYSRGACVADLTGRYINENLEEFGISEDDLYDYAFSTPAASAKNVKYANIHNVKNPYDIVPRVYPAVWDLATSGTEELVEPDEKQTVQLKMLSFAGGFTLADVTDSDGNPVEADLGEYDDQFLKLFTDNITREEFSKIGPVIGRIICLYLNMPAEKKEALGAFASAAFGNINYLEAAPMLLSLLGLQKGEPEYKEAITNLSNYIIGLFDAQDHSAALSDSEYTMLKSALPDLLEALIPIVITDLTNPNGMLSSITTFIGNVKHITLDQHHPLDFFPLVKKYDSYYTDDIEIARGKAVYAGEEMPEDVLYDDDALLARGFDETDIEYLKKGYDVTYGIDLDVNTLSYYSYLSEDSGIKTRVDDYLEKTGSVLSDGNEAYSIYMYGFRQRGFEDQTVLETDFAPGISGTLNVVNDFIPTTDNIKVIFLGDEADENYTVVDSEVTDGETDDERILNFRFAGNGIYAFVAIQPKEPVDDSSEPEEESETEEESQPEEESRTEEESQPEEESRAEDISEPEESSESEGSSAAEESSKTEEAPKPADSSKPADGNPNTGAAVPAVIVFITAAVLMVAVVKKRK